jgi:short chain dehydrogenase
VVIARELNTRGGNDHQLPLSNSDLGHWRREHSMRQFAGKVALITGGNAGIGRAAAIEFAKQGAKVVISGRREKEGHDVIAEINALGGEAIFVTTDVSQESDVKAMIERTLATFGRLDYAFTRCIPLYTRTAMRTMPLVCARSLRPESGLKSLPKRIVPGVFSVTA